MSKNDNIVALNTLGQSVWYDNCSRDVLNSGELARLIGAGVSGLTSNPTIFKKAIADTDDYDEDIRQLMQQDKSVEEICTELMIQDVRAAADLLADTYQETKSLDGYASIEVSPFLADDTQKTIEAARMLWSTLDRPNLMVKIPATPAGLPAIETALREGINVNITLIFSESVYRQVVEAYLNALEARLEAGEKLGSVASVASFFISRVDSICEKSVDKQADASKSERFASEGLGKIGIANSKVAYAAYEEIFQSDRFDQLRKGGAQVQRPLWASTSTKNPEFPPLLYLEELAGRDTVNTLPPSTLETLLAGAEVAPKLHEGLDQARDQLKMLREIELPLEDLLLELRDAGVKAFADSYQELLDAISEKSKAVAA